MLLKQTIKILFIGLYLSVFQGFGQTEPVKIIKFEDLRKMMNHVSDTTLVVHFWATWCKPCVEELPNFEKLSREYSKKKIRFVMVSMDFPKDIQEKVIPFVIQVNLNAIPAAYHAVISFADGSTRLKQRKDLAWVF